MIRKTKKTDIRPKSEEKALQRAEARLSPYAWFDEMDRWFDDFRKEVQNRFWGPLVLSPWAEASGQRARAPLVDLLDEGREFVVRAELPGVTKEDLDLSVTADGIELRAETHREKEETDRDYYYRERAYNAFHRVLSFPEEVLPDQAEATLKDGVLEVRVPRKEPTPRREPVKVRVN